MNKRSKDKEILKRVQDNDPTLTELNIGRGGGIFFQRATSSDFSTLGEAISKNTHITKLAIGIHGLAIEMQYDYGYSGFSNGLRQNSSICELTIRCYGNSIAGAVSTVLQAFQTNNNLTRLEISRLPNCIENLGRRIYMISNKGKRIILNTLEKCTSLKTIDIVLDGGKTDEEFKKECQRIVERSGQKNNSSPLLRISNEQPSPPILQFSTTPMKPSIDREAWKRVSMIILGEVLATHIEKARERIRDLLSILLNTVKNGCCSNVGPGYMCGHCEASINVIRISRAVILSICKLPLKKIRDRDTSRDLKRIRSWVCNQVKEFKDDSGDEIKAVLPQKLSKLISLKKFDIQPPWGEDDFGILLQQPSPIWIIRINVLMLMGYKVALVNFNDVARFSRKDLKVVHSDFSRLLCPADNGDDDASDSESDVRVADDEKESPPAKLHDEKLFQQPPSQYGDCPICCLRMPVLDTGRRYMSCCGKIICSGCTYTSERINDLCPLCSTPVPTSEEEENKRTSKRAETGDPIAIFNLGGYLMAGSFGLQQDYDKGLDLWHRAGELGCAQAYFNIGNAYYNGRGVKEGVKEDKKKAIHYWELAAMHGHAVARYNLGFMEGEAGNYDRALKHHLIAAGAGHSESLYIVRNLYTEGNATKEDYTALLRVYQEYLDEIKSDQRDEAAAYDEKKYKYYE